MISLEITPERLEAVGFKKVDDDWFSLTPFHFEIIFQGGNWIPVTGSYKLKPIQFIHELQDLVKCLSGKELDTEKLFK